MISQFWLYFKLGLLHVLDFDAYDHVLFFIALIAPFTFREWKRALLLVRIFTIGHTVTLLLSVYGVVKIPSDLVEFLIPLTIIITGVINVCISGKENILDKVGLTLLAPLFYGIVHGLGFSNYFRQIVAAEEGKLIPLLEFALGIETSQIIVAICILFFAFLFQKILRFTRREWILMLSCLAIGVALPMLKENYIDFFH